MPYKKIITIVVLISVTMIFVFDNNETKNTDRVYFFDKENSTLSFDGKIVKITIPVEMTYVGAGSEVNWPYDIYYDFVTSGVDFMGTSDWRITLLPMDTVGDFRVQNFKDCLKSEEINCVEKIKGQTTSGNDIFGGLDDRVEIDGGGVAYFDFFTVFLEDKNIAVVGSFQSEWWPNSSINDVNKRERAKKVMIDIMETVR